MSERTPLLNGIRYPGNSFVLPEHKMVYMSVTKVACTSLRWMIADLVGEDFETFYRAPAAHQSRLMTIHTDRALWKQAPQLKNVPDELIQRISRDDGWLIFAVVRDPWSRLWSAWQSKFLVRHAAYVNKFSGEPWFPRVPRSSEDVIEDWRTFVHAEPWITNEALAVDVHFKTQAYSVRPDGVNYTKIYDLQDMSTLVHDIESHLASLGMARRLYLPRANENPLPLTRRVLADGVAEAIATSYKEDFDRFGERWNLESLRYAPDGWSEDALAHVRFHTIANERIGDMAQTLRATRKAWKREERRNQQLRDRLRSLEASPSRRLVARARGMAQRIRRG